MKVFISNNYGGEICKFEFAREEEDCFGFGVRIDGFIETNSARIQHLTSTGRFVKDELCFKIPRNIIPTFQSKNFKVEYRADCMMIYRDRKEGFTFPINIFNNNIEDFNYRDPICIELEVIEEDEFIRNREAACRILLDNMNLSSNPLNYFNYAVEGGTASDKPESVSFIERKVEYNTSASSPSIDLADLEPNAVDKQPKGEPDGGGNNVKNGSVTLGLERLPELSSGDKGADSKADVEESTNANTSTILQLGSRDGKEDAAISDALELRPAKAQRGDGHPIQPGTFPEQFLDEINSIAENIVDKAVKDVNVPDDSLLESYEKEEKTISSELKENLGKILSKMFEEKCKVESEILRTLHKIQQDTDVPVFSERNVLKIRNNENSYVIVDEDSKLASVHHPEFIQGQGYVKISYLKNVRNTQIQIWREDVADGTLIDAQNIYSLTFDSDNCLEKIFEFSIDGFTLKTFAFEVLYILRIEMDGSEIRVPLTVLSPNAITSVVN